MTMGLNTEVTHKGKTFHIQTEERGEAPLLIETLIYEKGRIVASRRTYINKELSKEERLTLMRRQHRTVVSEIASGKLRFDHQEKLEEKRPLSPTGSLDDLIINHLSSALNVEGLNLKLLSFSQGEIENEIFLKVATTRGITEKPLMGIRVSFKLIREGHPPIEIVSALTNEEGTCEVRVPLPCGKIEDYALLIEAEGKEGSDRLIQPLTGEENEER
ncbi:MAG: hypothetical protein J7L64_09815 [Acidobacteria bacterium]|nr:hypothetical protein [Acidobacteriota bacterium]